MAATELKKNGKPDLRDFLVNRQIIPAVNFPTPAEIAAHLTPGDAKALVQELIKQYAVKPDRLVVFWRKATHATPSWPRSRRPSKRQRRRSDDRATFRTPGHRHLRWVDGVRGFLCRARRSLEFAKGSETTSFHFRIEPKGMSNRDRILVMSPGLGGNSGDGITSSGNK